MSSRLVGNFILVGPKGCGKSSTGNTIHGDLCYSIGDHLEDGTFKIKSVERNGCLMGDCLGFGDPSADGRFGDVALYKEFGQVKSQLVDKKFKFLFCIKFDPSHNPNTHFVDACHQFVQVFGEDGVASTVFVVIQEANARDYESFVSVLHRTSGYKLMKQGNGNRDIPFVLWDNKQPYASQVTNLCEKVNQVEEFLFEPLRFVVIERQMQLIISQRRARALELEKEATEKKLLEAEQKADELQKKLDDRWCSVM